MTPSDSEATHEEVAPITTDAMARILDTRVRSNAKNNAKVVKTGTAKTATKTAARPAATDEIPIIIAPVPGEAIVAVEIPAKDVAHETSPDSQVAAAASGEISRNLSELRELILSIQETQENRDHAFDLLYEELNGYKNDFYLERLKPTLRALLFLLDSIEEFEREVEASDTRGDALSSEAVKANLVHFRDQLTDVLTLSEMTPIEPSGDRFDPKTQRAIEVVKVEPAQNNTVQRQIRGGWKLGATMLRPADVVVGRSQ